MRVVLCPYRSLLSLRQQKDTSPWVILLHAWAGVFARDSRYIGQARRAREGQP